MEKKRTHPPNLKMSYRFPHLVYNALFFFFLAKKVYTALDVIVCDNFPHDSFSCFSPPDYAFSHSLILSFSVIAEYVLPNFVKY